MTEARLTTDWRIARSVAIRIVIEYREFFGRNLNELLEKADEIAEYIVRGRKE